jgi:hypothetical protein
MVCPASADGEPEETEAVMWSGYAKDVLVSTGWVAEHKDDANVVVAEVDVNTGSVRGGSHSKRCQTALER